MRIRSITSFYDSTSPNAESDLKKLAEISNILRKEITESIVPVQSTRLATIPFPYFLMPLSITERNRWVASKLEVIKSMGWNYLSLGAALPTFPASYDMIPQILEKASNVFMSGIIADNHHIFTQAVKISADVILQNARIDLKGFTNLNFAALANVPPWTPFLPAAYHKKGEPPAISLAVECADAVNNAFNGSDDLEESGKLLISTLETVAGRISSIIERVIGHSIVEFKGFDFSPAPFPEDWCSLGGGVEKLGLDYIGGNGSLAAVAFIADSLDKGNWKRAGFNGMMLPVLEDSILSRRAAEGKLTIKDLLLFSTVCGTGLDTIPLSGEVTKDQISSLLMDIATLSVRLDKPLTARLMPVPGKNPGEMTDFSFNFFANSCIMDLEGQTLSPPLSSDKPISLSPRKHK